MTGKCYFGTKLRWRLAKVELCYACDYSHTHLRLPPYSTADLTLYMLLKGMCHAVRADLPTN